MEERVNAMGGDYLSSDIGSDYDIILAFATLNFAKHAMPDMLKKLYKALMQVVFLLLLVMVLILMVHCQLICLQDGYLSH